jgi:hypothetical protein
VDYLALLKTDRRRDTQVAEFTDMLKSAKVFATTYNDGKGLPIISPWAMTRTGFHEARDKREYSLASLSDTSEAEKSPDILMWMLAFPNEPGKVNAGFLKTRDSDLPPNFELDVDFKSTYLAGVKDAAEVEELLAGMHQGGRL